MSQPLEEAGYGCDDDDGSLAHIKLPTSVNSESLKKFKRSPILSWLLSQGIHLNSLESLPIL